MSLEHPLFLPIAFLLATGIVVLTIAMGRNASMKRRLNPVLFGANAALVAVLWFFAGHEAVGLVFVVLGLVAYLLATQTTRFCDACGTTVFPRATSLPRQCPKCRDDLRAQASARAAGIHRDARLARGA